MYQRSRVPSRALLLLHSGTLPGGTPKSQRRVMYAANYQAGNEILPARNLHYKHGRAALSTWGGAVLAHLGPFVMWAKLLIFIRAGGLCAEDRLSLAEQGIFEALAMLG